MYTCDIFKGSNSTGRVSSITRTRIKKYLKAKCKELKKIKVVTTKEIT